MKVIKVKTTREITFAITGADKVRKSFTTFPAGTLVWVSDEPDRQTYVIRVCGTLLTQVVNPISFTEVGA
jgi:hypothetical protein